MIVFSQMQINLLIKDFPVGIFKSMVYFLSLSLHLPLSAQQDFPGHAISRPTEENKPAAPSPGIKSESQQPLIQSGLPHQHSTQRSSRFNATCAWKVECWKEHNRHSTMQIPPWNSPATLCTFPKVPMPGRRRESNGVPRNQHLTQL